ncbi:rhodanese [Chimaeribacter arupi]|uniref:Rhodanese-like domain-containing protein n=1 Tax=Nissabacter archeti TaxID=1917880 RepID=A0ABS5JF94_9GAMM|nr:MULTISPECIES: rhodanese-like domain-containing protein [Yersiniaceae]MBS0968621.1 rhodanese-like domain-containing protein [Nissabacter archeti]MDV5139757.1 rhodanese-like domain-containing protein [Chimaeribacter arupi]PLR46651.1 rhodanese [Chimaeribacter arupi]WKZ94598.1 rhodanese-like domain-containing protein [Chimaeribacter arupi]
MPSLISEVPAASPAESLQHFSRRLAFETDCSDVHQSQKTGNVDYVLVDVRSGEAFAKAHVPGAISIPTRTLTEERMSGYPRETLFVVYCAGPHCNGVHRAAIRLAGLGFAVKEMIGGLTGWVDEGLPLQGEHIPAPADGFSCEC